MTTLNQGALDYSNDAQYRVAADTRTLRKRTTLQIVAGTQEYAVPDDVIRILGVYDDLTQITPIATDMALRLISNSGSEVVSKLVCYTLNTQTIGFIPVPTEDFTATLYYIARPEPLTSARNFELVGIFESLVEHAMLASTLDDDGQPELASYEQGYYELEMARIRRYRVAEQRRRLPAQGYPRGNS